MKTIQHLFLLALVTLFMGGCQVNDPSTIYGQWRLEGYTANGSVSGCSTSDVHITIQSGNAFYINSCANAATATATTVVQANNNGTVAFESMLKGTDENLYWTWTNSQFTITRSFPAGGGSRYYNVTLTSANEMTWDFEGYTWTWQRISN